MKTFPAHIHASNIQGSALHRLRHVGFVMMLWGRAVTEVIAEPVPVLELQAASNGRYQLLWAAQYTGFVLEQSPALGPNSQWTEVGTQPQASGGQFRVEVTPGASPRFFRLRKEGPPALTRVLQTSPFSGERGVAVTRETIFWLSTPLSTNSVIGGGDLTASFGGRRLLSRPAISADRQSVTLFYLENLPAGSRVQVVFDGSGLLDRNGQALDADGDAIPGGKLEVEFDTFTTAPIERTGVQGRVFASEKNPDGSNRPLRNVTITVDGAEETQRTTTDAEGFFRLMPSPAGRFFVHVDGRTAEGSKWPVGEYYPFVGKAWEATAGVTNNLAGGTGEIYLPLVAADALRPVSATTATTIGLSTTVLNEHPEYAGLEITVPANALFSDSGARGGKIGMAPVPPDRLPEPLPAGVDLLMAVTIQSDGGLNFDEPVPVRFPNLPHPLTGYQMAPGEKTVLWSFNHDVGRWEPQGSMTVSADGRFIESDTGVGVRQPGWSGPSTPGTLTVGPGRRRGRGGGFDLPGFPGGGGSGGGRPDDDDCVIPISCSIPQPERRWLNCLLKCARDILSSPFSDEPGPARSPIDTGLRCIGGPDKCPGRSDDTLTPQQRACMDACQSPEPMRVVYFMPCEGGFIDPCPEPAIGGSIALASHQGSAARDIALAADDEDLLPDRLIEQERFWEVEGDFLVKLAGTPKILQMGIVDLPAFNAFIEELGERVQPNTPSGVHLSAEERAFLVALPRPSVFSAAEWGVLIDRFDALQEGPLPADVAQAQERLDSLVALLKQRGWTRRLDGFVEGYARLSDYRAPEFGTDEFPAREHYYLLRNLDADTERRGRLSASGIMQSQTLPPGAVHTIAYFDPGTGRAGAALFVSGAAGSVTLIPTAPFEEIEATEIDSDGDQLVDLVEEIIGTNPTVRDTDGDGVPDGAEVQNDGNPLDGIAEAFGFLAGVELNQQAHEVGVDNDLAVIRGDTTGLVAVDLQNPLEPIVVGTFPIADTTMSLDFRWPYALVGGQTWTWLVDFRDPSAPMAVQRWEQRGYAVAQAYGRAYIGGDAGLVAFDLETGAAVETIQYPGRAVHLRAAGGRLITVVDNPTRTLDILELTEGGDQLRSLGQIGAACEGCGQGLFAERDYAYVNSVYGYLVFDIRQPAMPVQLTQPGLDLIGGGAMEKDGGNLILSGNFTSGSVLDSRLGIYDASNPNMSSTYLGGLNVVNGTIYDFAAYRGRVVLVRSDPLLPNRGGLEVHGYRTRDASTNPPTLQLQAFTLRSAPLAEQSLGWFRVYPGVTDDVCVRDVEFYLDGNRVATSGSNPFEVDLRAPESSATRTNFTLQARAFDTAGNSRWSSVMTIGLVPEVRAPRLLTFEPTSGTLGLTGTVFTVAAQFNEPIKSDTLGDGFFVTSAGADRAHGTSDDVRLVSGHSAQPGNEYRLVMDQPLPVGSYRAAVNTNLTDLFGNRLFNPAEWVFEVRGPLNWTGGSGLWTEVGHWSEQRIPALNDFVRIDVPEAAEVTLQPGGAGLRFHDLVAAEPVVFRGGMVLEVGSQARFEEPLRIGVAGQPLQQFEANILGGVSLVHRGLELQGGLRLQDHAVILDSPQVPSRFVDAGLLLSKYVLNLGSSLTVQPGTELQVDQSSASTATWNLSDAESRFENRGAVRKRGAGTFQFHGTGRFINEGSMIIEEGAANGFGAVLENHGIIQIQPGASFTSGGIFPPARHSRTAEITGGGTNILNGRSEFEFEYGFPGLTISEGDKEFRAGIRNTGDWVIVGGPVYVRGLFADFQGHVQLGGPGPGQIGRLDLRSTGEAVIRDMTILQGSITGIGRVRFASPLTISNVFSLTAVGSTYAVSFEAAVELVGRSAGNAYLQTQDGAVRMEFMGGVRWTRGPAQFDTNAVVVAGATFTAEGDELTELLGNNAGLTVLGTYRKAGSGTNRIQRLVNSGQVIIENGTVQSLLSRLEPGYLQRAGELRLAGGKLDVRLGPESSTVPGTVQIDAGDLSGSGPIVGDVTLTGGILRPGTAAAAGRIEIQGELRLEPNATWVVKIGGKEAGVNHDQVVASTTDLGGNLQIQRMGNYQPAPGDEFIISTYQGRSAQTFRQISGADLGGGLRFEVLHEAGTLKLRVVQ